MPGTSSDAPSRAGRSLSAGWRYALALSISGLGWGAIAASIADTDDDGPLAGWLLIADPALGLWDIRMPVRDGLSAPEVLLHRHPQLQIIVLTTFDTDDMVLSALRLGAAGFMLKDTPPARLVEAVRTVASGQPMLSPSVTAQLIAAVSLPASAESDRGQVARDALQLAILVHDADH